jgi:phosphoribosylformylglycinamidine synthase
VALLIGETQGHLGQSALLAEVFGREDGDAPPVDLDAERRNGRFLLAHRRLITAATDLSDGGLALAAFELALAAGVGLAIDRADTAFLFAEDQARYLLACAPADAAALVAAGGAAGVPVTPVGRFGGDEMSFDVAKAPLAELAMLYEAAFAAVLG